jgi:hypothetical protein
MNDNLVLTPTVYEVKIEGNKYTIERVDGKQGPKWAIRQDWGTCLSQDLEWVYEPQPSSRTTIWLELHRYPTLEAAKEVLNRYLNRDKSGAV